MKKILVLLMIFSCKVMLIYSSDDSSKQSNNGGYDVKEAARKFRKKHAVDNLEHNDKPKCHPMLVEGERISSRKAIRDSIIDLVEKNGLEYIYQNNTTGSLWGWDLEHLVPLEVAIEENDKPLVKFLLQHGAKLNEPIDFGSGMTHYAIENVCTIEMAQYLEENGADLSPLFKQLHSWQIKELPELHEYLKNRKADFHKQNQPIFDQKKHNNNNDYDVKEAARKFRKKHGEAKTNPLTLRDYKRFHFPEETEEEFLEREAEKYSGTKNQILDQIEKHGSAAIHSDMGRQRWHAQHYTSPLETAVENDDIPFIKFLLQHGANPNQSYTYDLYTKDGALKTTVSLIEYVQSPEIAEYLEENGADLSPLFDYSFNSSFIKKNPNLGEYIEKKKAASNWKDMPRFIEPHILKDNSTEFNK